MNQNGKDKKRLELWEQYEDAYIQMLVYEVAKMEGEELLEKNERLKNDPDFQVPESITEKCLETIRREVAKREKQKRIASIRRVAIRVACVAAILAAMAVTAYAAFPSFRRAALNLLIQTSEVSTRLVLGELNEVGDIIDSDIGKSNVEKTVFDYVIPEMPEGFMLESENCGNILAWLQYYNKQGDGIKLSFSRDIDHAIEVDTEDAVLEEVMINGYDGLLCIKNEETKVVWYDSQTDCFVMITGMDVERDIVLQLADGIKQNDEN